MATNYPSGLDTYTNPAGTDALSTGHAAQHANVNDAVEAIEAELGTDPAGASATVKTRFEAIEANSWVTSARIADGTVTGTDIASATVTSANLVDGTIVNADVSGTAAIDKTKISGTAVTAADTGTVTSAMILDGTIVNADINAAAAIDKTKISGTAVTTADSGSVTSGMILDGTIVNVDVNAAAAIAATKIAGTAVTQADTGTVTSTMIANGTITGTDIATGTVTSTNIADGTLVNADIATGAAIDISKISGGVTSAAVGNLLTANQASLETDTTGWNVGSSYFSTAGGYTLTRDATDAYRGAASGKVVGDGTATYQGPYVSVTGLTANTTYTVCAVVKTSGTGPGVSLNFRDATGSANYQSAVVSSTKRNEHRVTFTTGASAGTASFSIAPRTAAAETFWFDAVGLWKGAGGDWALPGTPITGTTPIDGSITPIKQSAGYTAKTALYTPTYDDSVIDCTSGTYTVTLPTAVSQTGRTFIIRNSGTGTITIGRTGSETIAGATSQTLAGLGFLEVISNGTNWLVTRGQYADETVGRRLWTWNHAYSAGGGWQRTHADTGWRNITALATNFSGGNLYLRRFGDRVSIIASALASAAALDGTNVHNTTVVAHTTGFEPVIVGVESNAIINQGGGYWQQMALYNDGTSVLLNRMHRMGADYPTVWASGAVLYFEKSYSTTVAWPASLPGTASGTIPA